MGKKYEEKKKIVDKQTAYALTEAVSLLKQTSYTNFDGTVEASFRLGVDTRHSDQQVRGTLTLPHGIGKDVRVAVISKDDKFVEAKDAGAVVVGGEDLVEEIKKGFLDFDVLISTPNMMKSVGTLGKILGRRGLMPSPKTGTVTQNVAAAVNEFKAGKVEYRADKYGIVNMAIGKVSFGENKIADNFRAIYDTLIKVKPAAAKGQYMKNVTLAPTMGPSVKVDVQKIKA